MLTQNRTAGRSGQVTRLICEVGFSPTNGELNLRCPFACEKRRAANLPALELRRDKFLGRAVREDKVNFRNIGRHGIYRHLRGNGRSYGLVGVRLREEVRRRAIVIGDSDFHDDAIS